MKFLLSIIKSSKDKKLSLIDIDTGAGHLIAAAEYFGINSTGVDVNKTLVELGNNIMMEHYGLNKKKITCLQSETEIVSSIRFSEADVINLICILNHCNDLNLYLQNFQSSSARYLFLKVPLFSFGSLVSASHWDIYPRVLGGAHTHLFTEDSINYLFRKYELSILGEWRFGLDILDLKRTILNSFEITKISAKFEEQLNKIFNISVVDEMQSVLDRHYISDEIHFVLEKKLL